MKRSTMKKQRRVLRGWVKWVPVVAIPFAVLFFHTWMNIQILRADYVLRELDAEARELADRLNHTGVAETIHEDPAMLAEQAEQLAFVQPSPGQREIIYYDPGVPLVAPEDEEIAVAQRDGQSQTDPVETESLTDQSKSAPVPQVDSTVPVAAPRVEVPLTTMSPVEPAMPVAVSEDVSLESTPVPAVDTPDNAVSGVVQEAPMVEEVVDLESAMESLESL